MSDHPWGSDCRAVSSKLECIQQYMQHTSDSGITESEATGLKEIYSGYASIFTNLNRPDDFAEDSGSLSRTLQKAAQLAKSIPNFQSTGEHDKVAHSALDGGKLMRQLVVFAREIMDSLRENVRSQDQDIHRKINDISRKIKKLQSSSEGGREDRFFAAGPSNRSQGTYNYYYNNNQDGSSVGSMPISGSNNNIGVSNAKFYSFAAGSHYNDGENTSS